MIRASKFSQIQLDWFGARAQNTQRNGHANTLLEVARKWAPKIHCIAMEKSVALKRATWIRRSLAEKVTKIERLRWRHKNHGDLRSSSRHNNHHYQHHSRHQHHQHLQVDSSKRDYIACADYIVYMISARKVPQQKWMGKQKQQQQVPNIEFNEPLKFGLNLNLCAIEFVSGANYEFSGQEKS